MGGVCRTRDQALRSDHATRGTNARYVLHVADTEGAYFRVISAILAHHGKVYTPDLRSKVLGMQAVDTCKTLVSETNLPIRWQDMHAQFQPKLFTLVANTSLLPGTANIP